MTTYFDQHCPLCGAAAKYCVVDYGNRKYFDCPNCSSFEISRRAESLLVQRHQHRRVHYASQARSAPANRVLLIRLPDQHFGQHGSDELVTSFVDKAALRLDYA